MLKTCRFWIASWMACTLQKIEWQGVDLERP
jgi:hypothetical protein